MASYNKVLLMGNLTRDIELRHTAGNNPVANFGLAVNRRFKSKEGEAREEVSFFDCEAWGRTAEVMQQYLSKGRPVFIEGRLKQDTWEDKDGSKKSKVRIVVENFQFIDSKGGGGGDEHEGASGGVRSNRAPSYSGAPASGGGGHEVINDADIPF
jgi:single-strand DNA-binding protein